MGDVTELTKTTAKFRSKKSKDLSLTQGHALFPQLVPVNFRRKARSVGRAGSDRAPTELRPSSTAQASRARAWARCLLDKHLE